MTASLPFSLRQLQYAVAVEDTLSFRRAAELCHVAQPSLSAQVAELEGALGVRLFERDRRRVLVTSAGRPLLARARAVLREAADLGELARRTEDPLAGTLRLGVIPTVSPYLLPVLTKAFRRAFPRLALRWTEDRTEALARGLEAGDLEGALVALEAADLGAFDHAVVGVDPFVLATAPDHPLGLRRGPVRPAELLRADVLLLDDGHCFRDQALAVCSSVKAHELAFRATSLPTLAQMVAGGAGVTLLPSLAVPTETARARLRVRSFAAPAPKRTLAFVWRRRSPLAPALTALAAEARRAYDAR